MPEIDEELVRQLREELEAERAERRELIEELRRSRPVERTRGVDTLRRAYEGADDPREIRRRRRGGREADRGAD